MAEPAAALVPADKLEGEIEEAISICGGDVMKALRVTLIANAFLETQIEHLSAEVSRGFTRRKRS